MKPSQLPKDGNFSGRVNKEIQKELKRLGVSVQDIVDAYIDSKLKIEVEFVEVNFVKPKIKDWDK